MKIEENPNIPFSLFISSYRRRKILDAMMSSNDRNKKEGEHIMSNYKKQLAEKMAREKTNKGDMNMSSKLSSKSTTSKFNKKGKDDDDRTSRFGGGEINTNEPPEPEVLLSILHRKSRF